MRLTVRHETHYRFDAPVHHSVQYLRMTPRNDPCQRIINWSVTSPGRMTAWFDGFDNPVHTSNMDMPHDELKFIVEGDIETTDTVGVLPARDGLPPQIFLRETTFTEVTDDIIELAAHARQAAADTDTVSGLHVLMNDIADRVTYQSGVTTVDSNAAHALKTGAGVCQDHAHLFIAGARVLGVPARYVSGYLLAGVDNDSHFASHAWAEAYIERLGWVSFDPTNRQSATDAYVRLSIGFDYTGAAPVRGHRVGGGDEVMDIAVQINETQ